MDNKEKHIYVYAHWSEFERPEMIGFLDVNYLRGKEIFSFEYGEKWLKSSNVQNLDPDLQFYGGQQYTKDNKNNFGIFLDSAPDRWGRMLMRRREAVSAKSEKRKEKTLSESDYLLGVFDGHRMGAIRFKESEDGQFVNYNKDMPTPPWTSLRDLEFASFQLEKDNISNDPEYIKWLNLLFAPGSSLGGARPKANVVDKNNHLWIAKFPSRNDNINIGAWEMIVNELARKSEINIAEGMVKKLSLKHHTYLTRRFDRTIDGKRIHFASAMTMLGYSDHLDGASYLDFIEFIIKNGSNCNKDLEELWRRIVFNICVKNTDDHLRNHGFLLNPNGWILSPAFDVNPNPYGTGLSLNISYNDNSLDLKLALDVAEFFRVDSKKAKEIISIIKKVVGVWKVYAKKYKISKEEQELMSNTFWKD
jgi:serine/threonine-protein kinase HipA